MISEKIAKLRKIAGLSQDALAKKLDTTRTSVASWESGLNIPTTEHIVTLSRIFKVTPDYLLDFENAEQINVSRYTNQERRLLYDMMQYFEQVHDREEE